MFGSFLQAILGRVFRVVGVAVFVILVAQDISIGVAFAFAAALIGLGSYLAYLSRHTVRIRD